MDSQNMMLVWFAFVLTIIIGGAIYKKNKIAKLRAQDYDTYKRLYPAHFKNGRISCFKCNSTHIQTRSLMEKMYTRVHFCGQCGESLYYSPEK